MTTKYIPDWQNKNLTCVYCGETRSVKYENVNGEPMCNKCAYLRMDTEDEKLCTVK